MIWSWFVSKRIQAPLIIRGKYWNFFRLFDFARFALFFNHPTHCLVLAVRGTGSFKDVVTDLMADEVKSSL